MGIYSLCWDCSHATGGCSWANELKPVHGWVADEIKYQPSKPYTTYLVRSCPLFDRDAYDGGTRRTPKELELKKKR